MSSPNIKPNWMRRLSLTAIILLLTACQDYAARRDAISPYAGEAIAYNKAVHIIDPYPVRSNRTDIPHDGRRTVRIIERYQDGGGPPAGGASPAMIAVPMPAVPPPNAGP